MMLHDYCRIDVVFMVDPTAIAESFIFMDDLFVFTIFAQSICNIYSFVYGYHRKANTFQKGISKHKRPSVLCNDI